MIVLKNTRAKQHLNKTVSVLDLYYFVSCARQTPDLHHHPVSLPLISSVVPAAHTHRIRQRVQPKQLLQPSKRRATALPITLVTIAAVLPHRGPCSHASSSTRSLERVRLDDFKRRRACLHLHPQHREERVHAHQQLSEWHCIAARLRRIGTA